VLATAAGGPREIIHDGVDGVLLPPREPAAWAEAAARLLSDRDAIERIGAAARESAQRFDRDRYADAIIALYRGIT
jgi:D-inositol-3-phosphate glycosyltransferase